MVRALIFDGESTTLEADEDEDLPEITSEEDDDALADLYMPPNEDGSMAYIQVDADWMEICRENKFLINGPVYFAFLEEYELVLPAVRSRITGCPPGHVAIYAYMLDFGLRFPLDSFIVKVFIPGIFAWLN